MGVGFICGQKGACAYSLVPRLYRVRYRWQVFDGVYALHEKEMFRETFSPSYYPYALSALFSIFIYVG